MLTNIQGQETGTAPSTSPTLLSARLPSPRGIRSLKVFAGVSPSGNKTAPTTGLLDPGPSSSDLLYHQNYAEAAAPVDSYH